MQVYMEPLNFGDFYFPTLLPLKFTPSLTWKALVASQGVPIAADVIAYNASSPRKTRQVVAQLQGDIPKIAIAREKSEAELNEYFQLMNYAKQIPGADVMMAYVYDDMKFCWDGVAARLEWLALRAISTGHITLDVSNNAGIVTENAVDFLVPTAQKRGVTTVWSAANKATCTPITDIRTIVGLARKKGIMLKYILMNRDTFDVFSMATETVNFASAWVLQATSLTQTPNLTSINAAMTSANLPVIKVIDSNVTTENNSGVRTTANPWETGAVTFLTSEIAGNTYYAPLADEFIQDGTAAVKAKQGPTMIKKFSIEEPLTEITIGMANAFPAWGSASQSYMLDTLHSTFTF